MAIDRIESAPQIEKPRSRMRFNSDTVPPESQFEKIFTTAEVSTLSGSRPPADAGTAVEILRLQMLRSSLSLTDDDPDHAPLPASSFLSKALTTFIDQQNQHLPPPATVPQPVSTTVANPPCSLPGDQSLESIINRASLRYGVDAGLIKAVIKAESNFNPRAVSHAGAQGLMQLMPATARGLGVKDSFDAEQNVMAGTRFLKDMLTRYGGEVDSALAAYNWGPGNVDCHGDSLPRETREYLVKVRKFYRDYTT